MGKIVAVIVALGVVGYVVYAVSQESQTSPMAQQTKHVQLPASGSAAYVPQQDQKQLERDMMRQSKDVLKRQHELGQIYNQ